VPTRDAEPDPSILTPPEVVVTAKGMTRFRRPDCALVARRSVRAASATALVERRLSPREICEP
jgi:hypothetical protein